MKAQYDVMAELARIFLPDQLATGRAEHPRRFQAVYKKRALGALF
ncbi:hypothetical protein [Aeromonas aquatica]|nr:hypothetical protein [Aeromonas aquatica]